MGTVLNESLYLLSDGVKALSIVNVVYGDAPVRIAVVEVSYRPELFATGRVPDLHLNYLVIYTKCLDLKVNTYGT